MQITTHAHDDVVVAEVHEERIDASSAVQFKDVMQEIGRGDGSRVILDLTQVQFLDSSGLGAVVAVMKAFAPNKTLELAGLSPVVEKVFRLTRMDKVFKIYNSPEQALEAA
ncbi:MULTISPECIES: STAS domain-containing protein [unclassified Dinoroseobacter]|uniref:STAS domain-containing protein n=1 Tax=unclassified Dinoroseobacter TaxID=2620028 RepID=UPI003C7CE7FE